MNLHHRSTIRGEDAGVRHRPTARLQGMWLVTARIAWVILINKTLVYSLLTLLLAAAYAGLIIKLESPVGFFARANTQPLVMVVCTLVIAALFRPLRSRIQRVIERRFYRRTYDTTHTLEVFNSTLRNKVDLATLSQQLVAVVEETMQPAPISLWLRVPMHASYPMGSRDRRSCWSLGR